MPDPCPGPFAAERAAYERAKSYLLARYPGRFMVFKGERHTGPYATFEEAHDAGLDVFGLGPMLIKQILEVEPVALITRLAFPESNGPAVPPDERLKQKALALSVLLDLADDPGFKGWTMADWEELGATVNAILRRVIERETGKALDPAKARQM